VPAAACVAQMHRTVSTLQTTMGDLFPKLATCEACIGIRALAVTFVHAALSGCICASDHGQAACAAEDCAQMLIVTQAHAISESQRLLWPLKHLANAFLLQMMMLVVYAHADSAGGAAARMPAVHAAVMRALNSCLDNLNAPRHLGLLQFMSVLAWRTMQSALPA
jgi:hypothetical protein